VLVNLYEHRRQIVFDHSLCDLVYVIFRHLTYAEKLTGSLRSLTYGISIIPVSQAFWKVLDFSPKISRTWKILENEFGPGKSWNLPVVQLNQLAFYV